MPNSERKKTQTESLINTKPRFCLILPEQEAPASARALSCKRALRDATTASCGMLNGHTACLQEPRLGMGQYRGFPWRYATDPRCTQWFKSSLEGTLTWCVALDA